MELDPFAQRLLEITREARTPSERDKQRVERALSVSLGLAASAAAGSASGAVLSGASAAATARGSATGLVALKWLGAAALTASALTAGYLAFAPARAQAPVASSAPAPKDAPRAADPAPPAPVVESESAPEAPRAEPRAERRSVPGKTKKPETLAEELDLLHDAQAKWRNRDAAGALELIAQHKQRYPRSALAPEREALRVFSLCAAGRVDEARAVARRSFAKAPRSPLRTAVEESCARSEF